jgi:multidrug efflux pump subunit AcrB
MVSVLGFSFSGQGQNAALVFVTLKDWSSAPGPNSGQALAGRAFGAFMGIRDAFIFPLARRPFPNWAPPPASTSACRTAVATGTRRCWPPATSCWAWPRRARC